MKKNIRKLSESFLHAFRGLRLCIRDERNFRVHMTAAFYVILFGVFGGVSMTEAAILCICFGLTMGAELLNTAIERLCDKQASGYDGMVRNAKDIAAKLESITLKFRNQVGADGCIYGSVTSKEIADALKGQFGIVVDKRKILLDRPIKNFGKTTVSDKLHSEVTGKVVVDVEEDK